MEQAMASRLGRCIPNPEVPSAKPLSDSKVDSTFHPSKANQMRTKTSWGLSVEKQTVSL